LAKEYNSSCDEVERTIDDIYIKTEKLALLARMVVEIESCQRLLKYESGIYTHKRYSFSNISKDHTYKATQLDETGFQEFYFWMEHYLQKMHGFLTQLKRSTEGIAQSEFRLPSSSQPDPNASSIIKPFAFFDYLFQRNGISQLRRNFIPTEEDYDYHPYMHYDPKTEILTTQEQDGETGEWEEYKQSFRDKLFNRIYREFLNSRQLFDEHIDSLKTLDEINLFVRLSVGRIKYLLSTLDKSPDAKKYDFLPRPLKGLIKYLYERYEGFCPPKDDMVNDLLAKNNDAQLQQAPLSKALPPAHRGVQTFRCLKKTEEGFALLLHSQLNENCLIDSNTDLQTLRNAFNGSRQDNPLRIRWIDKGKNKQVNKQTLLYLLNELAAAGLIAEDTDNKTFLKRVHFIFADGAGEPLQNLEESNASSGKFKKAKTSAKRAIDAMISDLKQIP
jgi:hypothetical protein